MAVTILVINPAEYLRRARDTNRVSDLSTLKTALTLYTVDTGNDYSTPDNTVYVSLPDTSSTCATWGLPALPSPWVYACKTTTNYRKADGTGWVPVNLSSMASKPLSSLPVDPTNNVTYYYTFVKGGSFELNAITESQAYKTGPSTKQNLPGVISMGTKQNLSPIYNTTGLVGYWNFDETSGTTATDLSGNGNTGTLYGGPVWTTAGKVGGALSFDGVNYNDYVMLVTNTLLGINTGSFTVSYWVYARDFTYQKAWSPIGQPHAYQAENGGWSINTSYNQWGIYISLSDTVHGVEETLGIDDGYPIDFLNKWVNLNVVFDRTNNKVRAYINGVKQTYEVDISAVTGSIASAETIRISSHSGWKLDGLIDDVRVYNRALSASEVKALYNATK